MLNCYNPTNTYYLSMDEYDKLVESILKQLTWNLLLSQVKPIGYEDRIIECYHAPIEKMPLLINDGDPLITCIVRWRLEIGK